MKKVAFHNLGCKVNSYELDGIMQIFQNNGYEIVDFSQKADVYVVNTCTVTNIADRKSRQMLHKAKAQNEDAIVVATGCYAQTDTDGAIKDESIDLIVGNNEKTKIYEYVEKYMQDRKIGGDDAKTLGGTTIGDISKDTEYENFCIDKTNEHTRAYIKIQDGCNQFCSYCAIPLARGRVRSRDKADILVEVKKLSENGYQEVVVTGIHLSSYGIDFRQDGHDISYNAFAQGDAVNKELLDVLDAISRIEGIKRIRLGSLEPRLITDDFMESLVRIDKVCPHFHLSLQSGCDSVLKRMNRGYTASEYAKKVALIRRYYEHPAITTDIITGFPGETEEEFEETRKYAEEINLYETHVFKYSRRKGTVADKLPGQHTDKIKSLRSRILIEESAKRMAQFAAYYVGKEVEVLVEDEETVNGELYITGYTPEYVRCMIKKRDDLDTIVKVKGQQVIDGSLYCV